MRFSLWTRLSTYSVFLMSLHMLRCVKAECNTYEVGASADDFVMVFVDGVFASGFQSANIWAEVNMFNVTCATRVIAIQGYNVLAPYCSIRASDSSGYIVTDRSWKCTNISYPGWETVDFDDSMWQAAGIVTNKEPYGKVLNPNAQWIWTSTWNTSGCYNFVYCRKRLAVNECTLDPPYNQCNSSFGRCANTLDSYKCICYKGYVNIDNQTCADIDECRLTSPNNVCDEHKEQCVNVPGSYQCIPCMNENRNNTEMLPTAGNPVKRKIFDTSVIIIIILGALLGVSILVVIVLAVCLQRKPRQQMTVPIVLANSISVTESSGSFPSKPYEALDDNGKDNHMYEAVQ